MQQSAKTLAQPAGLHQIHTQSGNELTNVLDDMCAQDILISMKSTNPARTLDPFRSHYSILFAVLLVLCAFAGAARADDHFYGTVESINKNSVVVKTTKHSTDHAKIDASSNLTGHIVAGDWVYLEVETSGHVLVLRLEEHPAPRAGIIKEIKGEELFVRSGNDTENWNLKETTLLNGISRSDLKVGDEIGAKVYKNHNLAEVRLIKSGGK